MPRSLLLFVFALSCCYALDVTVTSSCLKTNHVSAPKNYNSPIETSRVSLPSRRTFLTASFAAIGSTKLTNNRRPANAADDQTTNGNADIKIKDYFTFTLPTNWKILTKPPPTSSSSSSPPSSKNQPSLFFSAVDLQSGSVLTVVQEKACNVQEYAQSDEKACDFVLRSSSSTDEKMSSSSSSLSLFSKETLTSDISKLLIRHDDRDNKVLQGTTKMDTYEYDDESFVDGRGAGVNGNDNKRRVVNVYSTTTLPISGTYRDGMGIERPNTIDRIVRAKSMVVVGDESTTKIMGTTNDDETGVRLLTLWLSAPSDEWQKPVMGTKLNQIWRSVKVGQ